MNFMTILKRIVRWRCTAFSTVIGNNPVAMKRLVRRLIPDALVWCRRRGPADYPAGASVCRDTEDITRAHVDAIMPTFIGITGRNRR